MLCDICHQNPVSVHVQQIINGEKTELHLCHECSARVEMPISFDNFFQGFLGSFFASGKNAVQQKSSESVICPQCGLSYAQFRKTGRMGCSVCYTAFKKEMDALLKNIQGSSLHNGKFPRKFGRELLNKRQLETLRTALAKSIENEEYEEAAKLRDQIRQLEGSGIK